MKFHMLMFMNAWMMLVLMKCRCQNAKLNIGVLQPLPLIEISSRDLQDLPFFVKSEIDFTQIILPFPSDILFTVVIPHHLVEFNNLALGYSFYFF